MNKFLFSSPTIREKFIFGASKPDPLSKDGVAEWIDFMKSKNIERICVLLQSSELDSYPNDILTIYESKFGTENVLHAPIPDLHFADKNLLITKIYPFLMNSKKEKKKVVIHCAGGIGRTGHVLAGWLMLEYQMSLTEAIQEIKKIGRNPLEAIEKGNEKFSDLESLLNL
ncbi:MAG: dual specificity protein phosphatase family protein [Candidatus Cloacimonadota bacterium]|nr:dual specificity protein phosphatase family protein [Candidatus Cloacimonadota bacterium]